MELMTSKMIETVSRELLQSTPPIRQAGLQLLNSIKLSPGSMGTASAAPWYTSQIEVDANATFRQYRKFLFQFSAMGFMNGTAAALQMLMRRNGGAKSNLYYYSWFGITGTTANVYGSSAGNSTIVVGPVDLTNNLGLRKVDV